MSEREAVWREIASRYFGGEDLRNGDAAMTAFIMAPWYRRWWHLIWG